MTTTETLSIVDSLYQSRLTLLHHTFTPYSSLAAAPHSLLQLTLPGGHGCTVSIGPHAFLHTHIFLCDWHPPSGAATPSSSSSTPGAPPPEPKPLSQATITPTLVAALNAASQTDKKLAEILRKAATGEATPDELAGLATLIDKLRRQEEEAAAGPPLPAPGPPGVTAPPSLVLDFAESRPNPATIGSSKAPLVDRRVVLPAHFVLTPLPPRNQNPRKPALLHDVLLSLFIFPTELTPPQSARGKQRLLAAPGADFNAPVPVDIVVEGCDQRMLEGLWRAARNGRPRDEQLERWARQMITAVPHRVHILHVPPAIAAATDAETGARGVDDPTASTSMSRSGSQSGLHPGTSAGGALSGTKRGASSRESPAASSGAVGASGTKRQRTLANAGAAAGSPAPPGGRAPPAKRGSRASAVRAGSAAASTPGGSSPAPNSGGRPVLSGAQSLDHSPDPSSPASTGTASTSRAAKRSKGKSKGKGKKRRSIFRVGSSEDDASDEEVTVVSGSRRRGAAAFDGIGGL
ncbi:hypothetical protein BMF94_2917 [Rhodotorula taiwanensis]|uniref:Uncharacterized protein n=1 Tax=Rhodotorula taiwanensis TaxID=741276 RepID=A0A2S5BBE6_9BASI|nr:hypothetical protein BMF94_2917 [Rhodotorula taiwanensis]